MFSLLHLLSYIGGLAAFMFVTLSLASGLLWLAELIEEHSRHAKYIGMRAIYVIIALHVLLLITDRLPFLPILFSIVAHIVYLQNFSASWPFISLTSPTFILSCLLVVGDHFVWFFHFANRAAEAKRYNRNSGNRYRHGHNPAAYIGEGGREYGFMDVAAFFGICVWAVPLFLFLSLSANDNALPSSMASGPPTPSGGASGIDLSSPNPFGRAQGFKQSRTSLLKSILEPILALLPRLRRRSGKRDDEGLLAPRTPIRGSPLHSPVNMNQSYLPWGEESSGQSSTGGAGGISRSGTPSNASGGSAYGASLSPEVAATSSARRSPVGNGGGIIPRMPPPRRVQSEVQVSTGSGHSTAQANPRGLATRQGKPAMPDAMLPSPTGSDAFSTEGDSLGLSVGGSGGAGGSGPKMGLGPTGTQKVGQTEIVESGLPKRKAD